MKRVPSKPSISIAIGVVLVFAAVWFLERARDERTGLARDTVDRTFANDHTPLGIASPPDLLEATAVSVSKEPQRLFLIETFPGRTPREGSARIGVNTRAPQTYSSGALLLNGARIAEIHNRFVVLERDGKKHRLEVHGARSSESSVTAVSELAVVGGEPPKSDGPEPAVDRLSQVLRMSPVYENDLLVGMRLHPGTRRGIFSQMGLQTSDVVVAIDGAPIADPAGMTRLFDPLTQGAHMVLTIKRNTRLHTLTLDGSVVIRELDATAYASLAR